MHPSASQFTNRTFGVCWHKSHGQFKRGPGAEGVVAEGPADRGQMRVNVSSSPLSRPLLPVHSEGQPRGRSRWPGRWRCISRVADLEAVGLIEGEKSVVLEWHTSAYTIS